MYVPLKKQGERIAATESIITSFNEAKNMSCWFCNASRICVSTQFNSFSDKHRDNRIRDNDEELLIPGYLK